MTFEHALEALKTGHKAWRNGWNGKGMWLALVTADNYIMDNSNLSVIFAGVHKLPWIGMKTADNGFVPWTPSQTDLFADDWVVEITLCG